MKYRRFVSKGMILFYLAFSLLLITEAFAADVSTVSKEELQSMLGNPEVIIVDVRSDGDWTASDVRIKGALREEPRAVKTWIDKYPKEKTLIFYCA
jgi:rhodanese-related sulfurtransferase